MKNLLRKVFSVVLALALLLGLALSEGTDESAKYDNVWMAEDGTRIDAYGEEGGFIVEISRLTDVDTGKGFIWELHASYIPGEDLLRAVTASKWDASLQDGELVKGDALQYEDTENTSTFTLKDGKLIWSDSKEDAGAGLTFTPIGRFEGTWPGIDSNADIMWADDHYTVYVSVKNEQGQEENYVYNAYLNPENGHLEATGTCDVITYDDHNQETGRQELTEDITADLYLNENFDLVWENTAPQGVKTQTFQSQFNLSLDETSNG